jgi:hypothetical protein
LSGGVKMRHEKIAGGTCHLAEIVVDYEKGTSDIKGVPPGNLENRLLTAAWEWIHETAVKYIISIVAMLGVFAVIKYTPPENFFTFMLSFYVGEIGILASLSLDKNLDERIKKHFARKTGEGTRDRLVLSDFASDVFVLPGFRNIVLEYEATGDVAEQLKKIHIREEQGSSVVSIQARVKSMLLADKNNRQWNAYFYFKKRPENGELSIEFI